MGRRIASVVSRGNFNHRAALDVNRILRLWKKTFNDSRRLTLEYQTLIGIVVIPALMLYGVCAILLASVTRAGELSRNRRHTAGCDVPKQHAMECFFITVAESQIWLPGEFARTWSVPGNFAGKSSLAE